MNPNASIFKDIFIRLSVLVQNTRTLFFENLRFRKFLMHKSVCYFLIFYYAIDKSRILKVSPKRH